MESPRNHGGSEEEEEEEDYSSCESGWTMYIEDTFHGNDQSSSVVVNDDDDDDEVDDDGRGEETDDSMASDASSGPSNHLPKNINKHAALEKNGSKQDNLQNRQQQQHTKKTLSNEGEKSELKGRTRASRVQSRGKPNKTQ